MADGPALAFRFEELRRTLDIQRETVDVLHARSNILLVALLGVVAFVGPEAIEASRVAASSVAAVGLTAALVALLISMEPRRFSWFVSPEQIGTLRLDDPAVTVDRLVAASLPAMVKAAQGNATNIARISICIRCEAAAAVATTVGLFLVLIIAQ